MTPHFSRPFATFMDAPDIGLDTASKKKDNSGLLKKKTKQNSHQGK